MSSSPMYKPLLPQSGPRETEPQTLCTGQLLGKTTHAFTRKDFPSSSVGALMPLFNEAVSEQPLCDHCPRAET